MKTTGEQTRGEVVRHSWKSNSSSYLILKAKEAAVFGEYVTAVSRELTPHGLSQESQLQVQHSAGLFKIPFSIPHVLLLL